MNKNKKNILIVDDDIETSKYKKWLEDEANNIDGNLNLTLINNPNMAEQIFKPKNYDLVLIGFRMSIMDGFDLYNKLYEMSKKVPQNISPLNDFRVCFMIAQE